MNKEELNNKAWYRVIKVLFFIAFIIIQAIGISIAYEVNGTNNNEYIKCDNGKEFKNPYPGIEYYKLDNEADLYRRCENSNSTLDIVPKELTFERYEKPQNIIIQKSLSVIATFIIISILFWIVSRIFFYIIWGEKIFKINNK